MKSNILKFKNKEVGDGRPVFIVAELSANHCGNFNLAMKTIKAMKEAGADAVKLQTYTADTLTIICDNPYFRIKQGTLWDGKTLHELYQQAYTPWEWQPKLKKFAEDIGLEFFSTAFDKSSVDFLEKLKVCAYKVASFEITDLPLIEYIASMGKPVIISTGMANLEVIKDAVNCCKKKKNNRIALLKCTSAYPAPLKESNLLTIPDMKEKFKIVVGLSDHALGINASLASVALGAKIIEKHFILDRKLGGPDSFFSLEPEEFRRMVESVREIEQSLGAVSYKLCAQVKRNRIFSRSLFVTADVRKGEIFSEENIRSIRPGFGLLPEYLKAVLGKHAKTDIRRGTPLAWKHVCASRKARI